MRCQAPNPNPPELGTSTSALNGVPTNGYPNYAERMMLVAINRARSDPNNTALETAGQGCATQCPAPNSGRSDCYTQFPAQPPLMFNYDGSRASRFHCQNLQKMNFGLSHTSPCTLRSDIGATGCDGSQSCACASNPNPNMCGKSGDPALWAGGTNPWDRCSYFGYSASGEVGAAGYATAWDAVYGWVGECADYEGHRKILTSSGFNETGCGYALQTSPSTCWSRYYFCDPGFASTVSTATLPAGAHKPETGGASQSFDFYVNYYSATGAAQSVQLVLDGTCVPMTREIGTATNATYKVSRVLGDAACHRYWFLATDGAGARALWPEVGSWGVGSCTDYLATAQAAACEGCVSGAACSANAGCQTGTVACPAGTCGNLSNAANGTSCGTDKVCFQGACTGCVAGGACTSADGCKTGTFSCATGQQVCGLTGNVANGASCGSNRVCYQGSCNACGAGASCESTDGCKTGAVACTSGQPVCGGFSNKSDGTSCGSGGVCNGGVCSACASGSACQSADGCSSGTIDCGTGTAVCSSLAPRPNGSACSGGVCSGGSCAACSAGAACTSTDGCKAGAIGCSTGQPVCGGFTDRPDGTSCAGGACRAGLCLPPADAGTVEPADAAAAVPPDAATVPPDAQVVVPPDAATTVPPEDAQVVVPPDAGAVVAPDAQLVAADAEAPIAPDADGVVAADAGATVAADSAVPTLPDAETAAPADAAAGVPPDAGSADDPPATVVAGCGCSTSASAPLWAGLALVLLAFRRRRA
ncbi:MAG TPA: MYXO-CTERM sorting domain-containing protein [Myxococcales bacterium]|jgi:hypothetical protein